MTGVTEETHRITKWDASKERATLVVFSDDWGRHPSSCQHLIRRFRGRHEVLWVNTIGMRPPTLGWSTVSRGLEKFRQWTGSPESSFESSEPNGDVSVLNPKMWPWFRRRLDRAVNRRLLQGQLQKALEDRTGPVVAITTIPIVADLMRELPVDRWVYYCVDDFAAWPGLDQKPLAVMEAEVIRQADTLIAASAVLKQRLEETRDGVALLPHGVDLEHWSLAGVSPHESLRELESPIVTFWGLVDRRMDREFLEQLSKRMERGTIVLVGPEDQPDPTLDEIPRLRRIEALAYDELPQIAQGTDALILAYIDAPVTRAMQPLKLLEYLATGRPVIARDLPATRPWSDCLDRGADAESFASIRHPPAGRRG